MAEQSYSSHRSPRPSPDQPRYGAALALHLVRRGFSVAPAAPGLPWRIDGKAVVNNRRGYTDPKWPLEVRPTGRELTGWLLTADPDLVVCAGPASGGLEALEFPTPESYELWKRVLDRTLDGPRPFTDRFACARDPMSTWVYFRSESEDNRRRRVLARWNRHVFPLVLHGRGSVVPVPVPEAGARSRRLPRYLPGRPELALTGRVNAWERALLIWVAEEMDERRPDWGGLLPWPAGRLPVAERIVFNRVVGFGELLPWCGFRETGRVGAAQLWRRGGRLPDVCAVVRRGQSDWLEPLTPDLQFLLTNSRCDPYHAFARLFGGYRPRDPAEAARALLAARGHAVEGIIGTYVG